MTQFELLQQARFLCSPDSAFEKRGRRSGINYAHDFYAYKALLSATKDTPLMKKLMSWLNQEVLSSTYLGTEPASADDGTMQLNSQLATMIERLTHTNVAEDGSHVGRTRGGSDKLYDDNLDESDEDQLACFPDHLQPATRQTQPILRLPAPARQTQPVLRLPAPVRQTQPARVPSPAFYNPSRNFSDATPAPAMQIHSDRAPAPPAFDNRESDGSLDYTNPPPALEDLPIRTQLAPTSYNARWTYSDHPPAQMVQALGAQSRKEFLRPDPADASYDARAMQAPLPNPIPNDRYIQHYESEQLEPRQARHPHTVRIPFAHTPCDGGAQSARPPPGLGLPARVAHTTRSVSTPFHGPSQSSPPPVATVSAPALYPANDQALAGSSGFDRFGRPHVTNAAPGSEGGAAGTTDGVADAPAMKPKPRRKKAAVEGSAVTTRQTRSRAAASEQT